jgi:hypothetical protein
VKPRDAATALARGRIAIGAAALVAPGPGGRLMFGRDGSGPGIKTLIRMLGGRDLVLGLGVVIALNRGAPVRGWLEAGAVADTVDLVACVLARDEMPRSAYINTLALAGGAAIAGLWLSRRLDPPPAATSGHPEAVATGHPTA